MWAASTQCRFYSPHSLSALITHSIVYQGNELLGHPGETSAACAPAFFCKVPTRRVNTVNLRGVIHRLNAEREQRGCKFWWRIRPRISRLDGKRSIHDSQCLTGIPLFGGLTAWFLHFPENLSWTCCIWNDLLKTTHTAWILVWGLPERFCIYVSTWMCGHAWMSA